MMKQLALGLVFAMGCTPALVGTGASHPLASDSTQQCVAHCKSIGLSLSSVVIMAENVGCVCSAAPAGAPGTASCGAGDPSVSAAGGMAAWLAQQQAAQAQQHTSHSSSPPPAPSFH